MAGSTPSPPESLLLPVWQEVCRHLEIAESAQAIAKLLREHVPLQSLALRRLEAEHRRVRTVASAGAKRSEHTPGDVHLSVAEWRRLERWTKVGEALHKSADSRETEAILNLLAHPIPSDDLFLAPLWGEHGSCGI